MAKIFAPLHSVSASGSIGGVLTFRASRQGSVATKKAQSYRQVSQNELLNQGRMIDAKASYLLLSEVDRARWAALAAPYGFSGWVYFFKMYQTQNIDPPNAPLIPEITIR